MAHYRRRDHRGAARPTADLIFSLEAIIVYVSRFTELVPGDVIATGTPEGVDFARRPPLWLRPGDVVEVEIAGMGTLATTSRQNGHRSKAQDDLKRVIARLCKRATQAWSRIPARKLEIEQTALLIQQDEWQRS